MKRLVDSKLIKVFSITGAVLIDNGDVENGSLMIEFPKGYVPIMMWGMLNSSFNLLSGPTEQPNATIAVKTPNFNLPDYTGFNSAVYQINSDNPPSNIKIIDIGRTAKQTLAEIANPTSDESDLYEKSGSDEYGDTILKIKEPTFLLGVYSPANSWES